MCKHENADHLRAGEGWALMDGTAMPDALCEQFRCLNCGDWLSLGPSNDEPVAVKVEIRAAEIAANTGRALRDGELFGWRSFGMGMFPYPGEVAGYLARAIAEHEEG